jgi:hypothetical protein
MSLALPFSAGGNPAARIQILANLGQHLRIFDREGGRWAQRAEKVPWNASNIRREALSPAAAARKTLSVPVYRGAAGR